MAKRKTTPKTTKTTITEAKATTAKAKRPTAAVKLKLAESKIKELETELETQVKCSYNANVERENTTKELARTTKLAKEYQRKLGEEQSLREQFFIDVDTLVDNYNKYNFFMKIVNAGKVLKSIVKLFRYYKEVVKNG